MHNLTLHESIGFGGQSTVFRATWDQGQGAAKVFEGKDQAQAEATWLNALNHPALPTCYGVVPVGDRWALVMEAIDGWTVTDLCRQGPASPPVVQALLYAVADLLRAAKKARLHHGDLKPDNLRIDSSGQVRVLDPASPGSPGTPGYAAPECRTGERSTAIDVYALGAIAFELLSGTPFGECGRSARSHNHRVEVATRTLDAALSIPAMLQWDPEARPALESLPKGDRAALARWAGVELPTRSVSRRWLLLPLALAVGVAGFVLTPTSRVDVRPPKESPIQTWNSGGTLSPRRLEASPQTSPPTVAKVEPTSRITYAVSIRGAKAGQLIGAEGSHPLPAHVPPGPYRWIASFARGQTAQGTVEVTGATNLVCDAGFKTCDVRP